MMSVIRDLVVMAAILSVGCIRNVAADMAPIAPIPGGSPSTRSATESFVFKGKAIHPKLVYFFEGWLSDRDPVVIAVDLDAADGSDQCSDPVKVDQSRVETSWANDTQQEWYAYSHVGAISDRYHVLRTFYSGGGTGVFQSVHIVKMTSWPSTQAGEPNHNVLLLVRSMPLGDRDEARVEVVNDEVHIGASRYRTDPVIMRIPGGRDGGN